METTPTVRHIRTKPQQAARCRRSTDQQGAVRTARAATDGFLRHSFFPLYRQEAPIQVNGMEQQFFASLEKLQQEYGFNKIDVTGKPYPYNVLLAFGNTQQQLQATGREITLSIQEDGCGETCLATTEVHQTGSTLYYLAILPLYRLLQDKQQKRTAELLLSVCSYLYHRAGVPYYRDEYEYVYNLYSCIEGWYEESREMGEEYDITAVSELNAALHYGDVMQRKLYNRYHLDHLAERINCYVPKSDIQEEVLKAAKQAFALLKEYPNERVFRHTGFENDEVYDDEVVWARQYISFVAETEGGLYYQMEQMVNEEFGNCGLTEIPTLTKYYNGQYQPDGATLDFEYRLFDLLDNVCFILNNLP